MTYAHTGKGEWTELAEEACAISGAPVDLLISKLEQLGLTTVDIHNIEYLGDREILNHLPGGFRWLQRNVREDVIAYFETMANLLESRLSRNLSTSVSAIIAIKEPGENAILEMV